MSDKIRNEKATAVILPKPIFARIVKENKEQKEVIKKYDCDEKNKKLSEKSNKSCIIE